MIKPFLKQREKDRQYFLCLRPFQPLFLLAKVQDLEEK
jgi:hypothetical protein